MKAPFLRSLNKAQLQAATTEAPFNLIIAGAGTGKTQTLGARAAHLIRNRGVSPSKILLLTFTTKAGREMRKRIEKMMERESRLYMLSCGTFHSFCISTIRRNSKSAGYRGEISIYDQQDQEDILRAMIAARTVKLSFRDVQHKLNRLEAGEPIPDRETQSLFDEYQKFLFTNKALDFHTMLTTMKTLLTEKQDVREEMARAYSHILIDEFQDTNLIQWEIVRLLFPKNLFLVGDDAQAIYNFRGGNVDIMLGIEKFYRNIRFISLKTNYRSGAKIIAGANALIKHNPRQYEKQLEAHKKDSIPDPIKAEQFITLTAEAEWIVGKVLLLLERGAAPQDIAILGRTHRYLYRFAELLKDAGIPVKKTRSKDIWTTLPARIFIAFLRLATNRGDNHSMQYILSALTTITGLDEAELKRARMVKSKTLFEAVEDAATRHTPWTPLLAFFDRWDEEEAPPAYPSAALKLLQGSMNIIGMFRDQKRESKFREYLSLMPALQEWEKEAWPDAKCATFLEWLGARAVQDQITNEEAVTVTTVHGAKGLEWPAVFVVGCEHGQYPHSLSIDEGPAAVEEERRLFYVAITRAGELLRLTRRMRDRDGGIAVPSPFLVEAGLLELPIRAGAKKRIENTSVWAAIVRLRAH